MFDFRAFPRNIRNTLPKLNRPKVRIAVLLAAVGLLVAIVSLGKNPVISPAPSSLDARNTGKPAALSANQGREVSSASAIDMLDATSLPAEHPETRLIAIYALIEKADFSTALVQARQLVEAYPHFQLAQLVYGDLLKLKYQPLADVSSTPSDNAQLTALRTESRKRLEALRYRPPPGSVPAQFVALSSGTRHAIAVDAMRSRLYLFEHHPGTSISVERSASPPHLKLVADYFISVGKAGIGKLLEGDGRTPLGGYYITSMRDKKGLPPFYGVGALPINYPNAFDSFKGRTGSGIWLHGTPPEQFARAPLASDGCVVLSNPDMQRLIDLVAPRTTPVVIADQLEWVQPEAQQAQALAFRPVLTKWMEARKSLSTAELTQQFGPSGANTTARMSVPPARNTYDLTLPAAATLDVVNLSLLHTKQPEEGMVATFEESVNGVGNGVTRRQYWLKANDQWKLLQDSLLSGPAAAGVATTRKPDPVKAAQASPAAKPAPTVARDTTSPPNKAAPASGGEEAVRQSLQAWTRAWSQKNMAGYFRAYDSSFVPPGGMNRAAWEKERTDRIANKTRITLTLNNVQIRVQGDQATVSFLQYYKADQLTVSGRKTLKMIRRGNDWRITQESVG